MLYILNTIVGVKIFNQINKIFDQINKSIKYLIRSTKYLIDIYELNGLIESIKFFSQCCLIFYYLFYKLYVLFQNKS